MTPGKRDVLTASALGVVAWALRALFVASVWSSPAVRLTTIDSTAYRERALSILAGEWLGHQIYFQDPLYPYLLAGLYALFSPDSIGVLLAQALLDSVTVVLVYGIARRIFDYRSAVLAGLLAALYKLFFYYDVLLLKPPLMLLLTTASLYLFVWAALSGRGGGWLGGGVALGLASLTRGNALFFAPALLVWLALAGEGRAARRARDAALVLLGIAAAVLPVTLRNYAVGDDWVLLSSQGGQNFYIGNFLGNDTGSYRAPPFVSPHPRTEESDFAREAERVTGRAMKPSEVSRYWLRRGLEDIAADPGHFARHLWRKTLLLVNHYEIPDNQSYDYFKKHVSPALRLPLPTWGGLLPLALCGMVYARRSRVALLLVAFFGAYAASLLVFYHFSRYRLPLVPVVIVFASFASWRLVDLLRARAFRRLVRPLAFLAVAYPLVHLEIVSPGLAIRYFNVGQAHLARAAELRAQAAELAAAGDEAAADDGYASALAERELAEEQFRIGLAEQPDHQRLRRAMLKSLLGRVLVAESRGQYDLALEAAERLTDAYPRFPEGYVRLGLARERLGREAEAIAALEEALRLAPEHERARAALVRLAPPVNSRSRSDRKPPPVRGSATGASPDPSRPAE